MCGVSYLQIYYHYEVVAVVMVSTAVKAFAGYVSVGCLAAKVSRFLQQSELCCCVFFLIWYANASAQL